MKSNEPEKTDALASFEADKARVLDFARQIQSVAVDRGDRESAEALGTLMRRFEENRFLVVSVGAFKTGKSTLLNALAGRRVCPMRSTPYTARLTRVLAARGERETIEIHFKAERPPETVDFSESALTELVSMKGQGKRLEEVASVDVAVKPSGLLVQPGVVLVDTPGLESGFDEHDKITREFLPRADLILLYFTAKQALGAKERDFLLAHPEVLKKSIVVLTHADAVPADELDEVIEHVRQRLKETVLGQDRELEMFVVSGKQALDGVLGGDDEQVERSGVRKLVARITEVLTVKRGLPILIAIAEGEKGVALGLVKQIAAARAVMQTKGSADIQERGRKLLGVLRGRSQALEASVSSQIERESQRIAGNVPVNVAAFRDDLKAAVWSWIETYQNEEVCKQQLPTALATYTQAWLEDHEGRLRYGFKKLNQDATATCSEGFDALQREAASAFERDRAVPAVAEIVGALDAIADLSAIANCMGGPVGGYGLASAAIEPVFSVPPAIKALTLGAGLLSVVAALGGPIGWGAAVLGWLAVGFANIVRSTTWRTRAFTEMSKAIYEQIVPKVANAISAEVWRFGRSLQEHMTTHVRRVHGRLAEVVQTLMNRVAADRAEDERKLRDLEQAEGHLKAIADDVSAFIVAKGTTGQEPAVSKEQES